MMARLRENRFLTPLLLFALALIVRLLFLGRADLWCDEILFVGLSTPPMSPLDVIAGQWDKLLFITHLPFPEVVQNVFLWLCHPIVFGGGHHPFLQRLPAVLWGAFTVSVFYRLSRRLFSSGIGLGATLMVCLFVFPVYYAREAYFYSPLIFCSTAALAILLETTDGEPLTRRRGFFFVLAATGMACSHLTGVIFAALILLSCPAQMLALKLTRRPVPRDLKIMTGLCLLPLLAVSPFILRLALNPVVSNPPPGISVASILYDAAGKLFMGSLPAPNIAACLLFAAGFIALAWPGEHASGRRMLLGLGLAGALVIAISASKSQYHVRYFSVLLPAVYMSLAAGLHGLAQTIFRRHGPAVFSGALALLLLVQAGFYLPLFYRLPAKSVDYGHMALWINENLEAGVPYLMESGYELRFLSGYFPTPKNTGAAPYIHGDIDILHQKQKEFLLRFPESPWIESARHGMSEDTELGAWTWPHLYFHRRVDLHNEQMERISALGLGLGYGRKALATERWTPIWYNTPDDIAQKARERGEAAIFRWTGWSCTPFAQDPQTRVVEYCWAAPGASGKLAIQNLGDQPVKGRVKLVLAIAAPAGTVGVSIRYQRTIPVNFSIPAGQLQALETGELEIPIGGSTLEIGVLPGARSAAVQGILIREARFITGASQ